MSVFDQVRAALKASKEPLSCAELLERCDEASNTTQIAGAMFAMVKSGEALRDGTPGSYRYSINPKHDPKQPKPAPTKAVSKAKPAKKPAPKKPQDKVTFSRGKPVDPPPALTPDFGIAINDAGELGISKGDVKVNLTPAEFARVRSFIEKTDTVWSQA